MTKPKRTEEDYERVRERLDEMMLEHPATAPLVREKPLSKKYQRGLIRPLKKGEREQ